MSDQMVINYCYVITWDNVDHIYATEEAAKASIGMSFPGALVAESEDSYNIKTYDVAMDGRVQYRVTILKCDIHALPTNFTTPRRSTAEF